jgi:hypothetical protein
MIHDLLAILPLLAFLLLQVFLLLLAFLLLADLFSYRCWHFCCR